MKFEVDGVDVHVPEKGISMMAFATEECGLFFALPCPATIGESQQQQSKIVGGPSGV